MCEPAELARPVASPFDARKIAGVDRSVSCCIAVVVCLFVIVVVAVGGAVLSERVMGRLTRGCSRVALVERV